MVSLRLHPRLQDRIDPLDVVQEVYLEAFKRLPGYLRERKLPFFLWLRWLTGNKLLDLHRHHLDAQARDPRREVSLFKGRAPGATSQLLAIHLMSKLTTPTRAARRAETKQRLEEALNRMDPTDREVLSLRHFEGLNNAETAEELDIKESAASKRYIRALKRLKGILAVMPGGLEGVEP
jgi:RNA polymerase sigma-70 factor (ECF subfamily)